MDFAGLYSSLQKFDQWSESYDIFKEYCLQQVECFCYTFLLCIFYKCISYDAFNADDLDKTSRDNLQIEKVIIPIF